MKRLKIELEKYLKQLKVKAGESKTKLYKGLFTKSATKVFLNKTIKFFILFILLRPKFQYSIFVFET